MSTELQPREPLLTRPLVMAMLANFGAMSTFYLLLSVMPLYAAEAGAGDGGAGLATGVMMLGTVLAELAVPWMLARRGYRAVLTLGLCLLGLPPLTLLVVDGAETVLAVCLARGAGLGIAVVAGTAVVAHLVPESRRGEGLGLSGMLSSVPSIAALPLGLWASQKYGYAPVLLAAAALALLPLFAVTGVPTSRPERGVRRGGLLGTLTGGGIAGPSTVFFAVTLATGVIMTFLPLSVPAATAGLLPAALLAQSVATPLARWWAGRFGDRRSPSALLLPAVVTAASGTALLCRAGSPLALFAGMALFGIGFGLAQSASLALLLARVERSEYSKVSALWNLVYDGGMGAGAAGFGLMAGHTGYQVGFLLTAVVVLVTAVPAVRDTRIQPAPRPQYKSRP
ncbi:MFS transporter [Streptomyces mesophilus]|uniref:MFS transporter n=1 Tax=Streptomyces mesophilus TaxID=1775132 RepID=UPI003325FF92